MSDSNEVSAFCAHKMSNCKRCNSNNCNDYEFTRVFPNESALLRDEIVSIKDIHIGSVPNGTAFNDTVTGGSVLPKSYAKIFLFAFIFTYVSKRENRFI